MRTLLLYLSLFFLSIATVHAQSMKKMVQKTEFENRLAKEAQTVESVSLPTWAKEPLTFNKLIGSGIRNSSFITALTLTDG